MNFLAKELRSALTDLQAAEVSRKHQLAIETLEHAKYLRERGNRIGVFCVLAHAVSFHRLNALQPQLDKAKAALVDAYGAQIAEVVANRAGIAATRAARGADVDELATFVAGAVKTRQVDLPAVKKAVPVGQHSLAA